jgi:ribosomal protein S18 acetylase RimI-like enzyme
MTYSTQPASEYSLPELGELITRGFEGYFVPIQIGEATLLRIIRQDSVDLASSSVVLSDGLPAGVALIARRGWESRVAAMGIVAERRGKGAGKFLMSTLIEAARQRGEHALVLEVIEQNLAALRLYENSGFVKVRRLASFSYDGDSTASSVTSLEEIDIRDMARAISMYGLPDLPWQASAETIAQYAPPVRAFRLGQAHAMISDPGRDQIAFYSLLVEPEGRGRGQAQALIRAVLAAFPGKAWQVPAFLPEEVGIVFQKSGFQPGPLTQWQMRLAL